MFEIKLKKLLKIIALLLTIVTLANCQKYDKSNPHDYYIKKKVCQLVSSRVYEKFYQLIHLSCDWNKFIDAETVKEQSKDLYTPRSTTTAADAKTTTGLPLTKIYDIHFKPAAVYSDDIKYKQIHSGLFTDLPLQSLTLSNLDLTTIQANTFDKECCGKHLAKLDMSKNLLKRFDASLIADLERLEHLNLADNQLDFASENFINNKNLKSLDISGNNIQFLPKDLLVGLNELNVVNMSRNQIRNVDVCTFKSIQTNPVDIKHNPATIDLTKTPIQCDCSIFALSRHLNYKVLLNCAGPGAYYGKNLRALRHEDPSSGCNYSDMVSECTNDGWLSVEISIILFILILLFIVSLFVVLYRNYNLTNQIKTLEESLSRQTSESTKATNYVDSSKRGAVEEPKDKDKLLV